MNLGNVDEAERNLAMVIDRLPTFIISYYQPYRVFTQCPDLLKYSLQICPSDSELKPASIPIPTDARVQAPQFQSQLGH
jgi:N-glycosylase/DNA lyase